MSATTQGARGGRWAISAGAGLGVMAAMLALFRFPVPPGGAGTGSLARLETPKPVLQLVTASVGGPLLRQESEIRDLRPLFLPTEINVSLPPPRREPGRTFLDNETLNLDFSEAELNIGRELPAIVVINKVPAEKAQPLDVLVAEGVGVGVPSGLGREPAAVAPRQTRGGAVDVVATATGQRVMSELLPAEASPPQGKSWEPLELLATVDATGLAAPLVIASSSRVDEIDNHYRNYLAQRFRIGERLPPGSYRIVVGP